MQDVTPAILHKCLRVEILMFFCLLFATVSDARADGCAQTFLARARSDVGDIELYRSAKGVLEGYLQRDGQCEKLFDPQILISPNQPVNGRLKFGFEPAERGYPDIYYELTNGERIVYRFDANKKLYKERGKPLLQALNDMALRMYRDGNLEGAATLWKEGIMLFSTYWPLLADAHGHRLCAEVLNNYGFALFKLGSRDNDEDLFEEAEKYLDQARDLDRDRHIVLLNLAELHEHRRDIIPAIETYGEFLKNEPRYKYRKKIEATISRLRKEYRASMLWSSVTAPLHASMPPYTFKYYLDQLDYNSYILIEEPDGTVFQRIEVDASVYDSDDPMQVQDFNGDGYADLRYLTGQGATGNQSFEVALYDPRSANYREAQDDEVPEFLYSDYKTNDDGTVRTYWKMGCAGLCYVSEQYKYIDGRYVLFRDAEQELDGEKQMYHLVVRELVNGQMQVVEDIWSKEGEIR